jgi:putative salt-induced outer membrane protein YdiY
MKLRLRGNSLRLRLVKSEVSRLVEIGLVEDGIRFRTGPGFRYSLETTEATAIAAHFENGHLRVVVPRALATQWAQTEAVSLSAEEMLSDGAQDTDGSRGTLKILIEKDFACRSPQAVWQEDSSDNFANPDPTCAPEST